ncbi:MAG: protein kinase [Candidatus Aminicenantes bacterium]|nr:MAG: protein kinase [Candidatus Aminicenantes bacterium]
MKDYKIISDFIIFDELDADSVGTNFRAGEIKERQVEKHCLLVDVHPSLTSSPIVWKRTRALIEGIKNQNIPGLYSPEKVIEEGEKALLIYPFHKGTSLENVLADAKEKGEPMDLDLIFSLVMEIADVLDSSSTIIINKRKSFHGALTPDNVIMDFDGKVSLRNYGIFPYLENAPQFLKETAKRFDEMLAPELVQGGNLTAQSDIYHLGNITYRLLTGQYFRYNPAETFESQLAKIDLEEHIYSSQEDFPKKCIGLFLRALNPDPSKRFASIKEFKEYISRHFRIEELSSATFMLAYFMNLLYKKTIEEEEIVLKEELSYTMPERRPVPKKPAAIREARLEDYKVEDLLIELEQQKRSRMKILVPFIVIFIVVIGIAAYLFISQQKEVQKQRQAAIQKDQEMKQEMERRITQMKSDLLAEYQKRLQLIEQKAATTEDEKKSQEEIIEQLKTWKEQQEQRLQKEAELATLQAKQRQQLAKQQQPVVKKEQPVVKKEQPVVKKEQQPEPAKEKVAAAKPKTQPSIKQEPVKQTKAPPVKEVKTIQVGDIIPIDSVTFTPSKLSGERKFMAADLALPKPITEKYKGQNLTITPDILVNELGSVTETKISEKLPDELQSKVDNILKTWTYIPAEKDKVKVKVWTRVKLTITFEGTPEKVTPGTQLTNIIPLRSVTFKPSKITGTRTLEAKNIKLSDSTRKKYEGKALTIDSDLLINEAGDVIQVKIKDKLPRELESTVTKRLKTWTYVPAEKDKTKVKVWLPATLTINFEGPPKPSVVRGAVIPLKSLTFRPSKVSGERKLEADELKLSNNIKNKYSGQTLTINSEILINETGKVIQVKIKDKWPQELKSKAEEIFKAWKYIAPEKDKVKVKTWMTARLNVAFKKAPPTPSKELSPEQLTNIIPLDSVTYRPSKISGERKLDADKLKLSRDTRKKYKGQTVTIKSTLLINETGGVIKVRVEGDWPDDIKTAAAMAFIKWKFIAAEKDKAKVKVWFPARLTISFE